MIDARGKIDPVSPFSNASCDFILLFKLNSLWMCMLAVSKRETISMHQYQYDTEQLLVNSRAEGIIYRRNQ